MFIYSFDLAKDFLLHLKTQNDHNKVSFQITFSTTSLFKGIEGDILIKLDAIVTTSPKNNVGSLE